MPDPRPPVVAAHERRGRGMPRPYQALSRGAPILLLLSVLACAPGRPSGDGSAFVRQGPLRAGESGGNFDGGAGSAQLAPGGQQITDKTLVIGIGSEVRGFSQLNNMQNKFVEDLIHGNLFLQDDRGRWFPAIAAETPRLDNGTWTLFEDGSSETIYRIKRGVKWHDGVELTVHDLAFFWKVATDRDLPFASRDRFERIRSMEPIDDYTLKTTWNLWEAEADSIDMRMIYPLPRHILAEPYAADKQAFINHPYWTNEFIGLGPFRLVRLEPGSHLELEAHDDYVLGRPGI